MGYCMYLMDSSIHLPKDHFASALNAVKAAFPQNGVIQSLTAFEDAMYEFCYMPEFNDDGDICGISFDGKKLWDDEIFWSALAPFIEDGDYIEMEGEDFNRWRWIFKNGICREIQPTITWEDE